MLHAFFWVLFVLGFCLFSFFSNKAEVVGNMLAIPLHHLRCAVICLSEPSELGNEFKSLSAF